MIKKIISMLLACALVFGISCSALASQILQSYPYDITTTNTTQFQIGCKDIYKTSNYWWIVLNENRSNLSPTHRAVVRVHKGYDAVSATWVYSGLKTTSHPFTPDCYGYQSGLSFRGRLDNRDTGILEFHGVFRCYFDPEC